MGGLGLVEAERARQTKLAGSDDGKLAGFVSVTVEQPSGTARSRQLEQEKGTSQPMRLSNV